MTERLEDKEIRGLTPKQIIWCFGVAGSILISILFNYFAIVGKIEKISDGMEMQRQNMQVLTIEIEKLKTEQNNIQIRLLTLEVQLKNKNLIPAN